MATPLSMTQPLPGLVPISAQTTFPEQGNVLSAGHGGTPDLSVDATLKFGSIVHANLDAASAALDGQYIAPEERDMMNNYRLREEFASDVAEAHLPQFFRHVGIESIYTDIAGGVRLDKDMLLENFRLSDCDVNDFRPSLASGDVAQIDLKALTVEGLADAEPTRIQLKSHELRKLRDYLAPLSVEYKRRQLSSLISGWLGKMPPLGETDLRAYIDKLLARMPAAELDDVLEQQHAFVIAVRKRVHLEMNRHRRKVFAHWVRTSEIFAAGGYPFPKEIHPTDLYTASSNTLYEREERARSTDLESRMADWLAGEENILWWHRNHQTRGFCLNGPINHYPDFIVRTKSNVTVLVETKGEHLKNDDSDTKVELGKLWQDCVGRAYRYIMVFDQVPVGGAVNWQEATDMLKRL